jgi:hypothetical protein
MVRAKLNLVPSLGMNGAVRLLPNMHCRYIFKGTLSQYVLNRFGRIVLEECPLFAKSD